MHNIFFYIYRRILPFMVRSPVSNIAGNNHRRRTLRTQTIVSPSGHTLELVNLLDETFNRFYGESVATSVLSEGDVVRPGEFAFARFVVDQLALLSNNQPIGVSVDDLIK